MLLRDRNGLDVCYGEIVLAATALTEVCYDILAAKFMCAGRHPAASRPTLLPLHKRAPGKRNGGGCSKSVHTKLVPEIQPDVVAAGTETSDVRLVRPIAGRSLERGGLAINRKTTNNGTGSRDENVSTDLDLVCRRYRPGNRTAEHNVVQR
ncbi:hypothetical protein EVAR_68955_1 [Eumeta japonica]|uniref:Uncharacterized protein n=1 Tax=Eumeta variegata TaxID=151549 RepID=A0A4C2AI60_EUMVA|nr:hypothetical protein EVAR_68955_1 [Eumeta japonica]